MTPDETESELGGFPAPSGILEKVEAHKALSARPRITLRARIAAVFALLFVLMLGITVTIMVLISDLASKATIVDNLAHYVFEIQQARRFEKDYLLYGTDISDALAHTHVADRYLDRSTERILPMFGEKAVRSMKDNLNHYEKLLEKTLTFSTGGESAREAEQRAIQGQLRKYGAQLLVEGEEVVERERLAMHSMMNSIVWLGIVFLLVMFFLMIIAAVYFSRALMNPLQRFMQYAARIGGGDYSPITPARRYRDEFSELGIAMNHMLSQLKTHQEQLTQAKKMAAVGSLTAGIAHELNNPLNNIGLTTEALLEDLQELSDEKKREMLKQIYSQIERATSTVRNLLDFTRREQPVFTSVDIRQVIQTTVRLLGNEMSLGGIDLNMDHVERVPPVKGNPRNLQQVFLNLLLNAIQAMPDGGKLTIRAGQEDGFVRVDIADTGVGIPKESLDKIFDPFFTTKEAGEGTGLGLSVSFGIIEKHRGRIIVESQIGEGTTFSIFLPLEPGHSEEQSS